MAGPEFSFEPGLLPHRPVVLSFDWDGETAVLPFTVEELHACLQSGHKAATAHRQAVCDHAWYEVPALFGDEPAKRCCDRCQLTEAVDPDGSTVLADDGCVTPVETG